MKTIEMLKNITTTIDPEEFGEEIEALATQDAQEIVNLYVCEEFPLDDIDLDAAISACEVDVKISIENWNNLDEDERSDFLAYHEGIHAWGRDWAVCLKTGEELAWNYDGDIYVK